MHRGRYSIKSSLSVSSPVATHAVQTGSQYTTCLKSVFLQKPLQSLRDMPKGRVAESLPNLVTANMSPRIRNPTSIFFVHKTGPTVLRQLRMLLCNRCTGKDEACPVSFLESLEPLQSLQVARVLPGRYFRHLCQLGKDSGRVWRATGNAKAVVGGRSKGSGIRPCLIRCGVYIPGA